MASNTQQYPALYIIFTLLPLPSFGHPPQIPSGFGEGWGGVQAKDRAKTQAFFLGICMQAGWLIKPRRYLDRHTSGASLVE